MKKRNAAFFLGIILFLSAGAAGCGTAAASSAASDGSQSAEAPASDTSGVSASGTSSASGSENAGAESDATLTVANSFAYASADVQKDYYGWYTSVEGISESLFRIGDDLGVEPCLAESGEVDDSGLVWTIALRDGICFSNGEPVTADMVCRNLERAGEVNDRFAYLSDFTFEASDDATVTITTKDPYPTMLNDLATPELGMMDLDHTEDFDLDPICTGPFQIQSFTPEGTVVVERNENYWGGTVALAGATFLYMPDDDSKLMAMQNGEIDGYTSVTSAAEEIFKADPETYQLTSVPATRLQFYVLNHTTLDENVRGAINKIVDKESIASFLNGTTSATDGPFSSEAAYGKVENPQTVDVDGAKELLEQDGYTLNGDGIYEKDGEPLTIRIAYYQSRSLDSLAILIQEQLKNAGIDSTLTSEEDPDATYVSSGAADLALYCSISDKGGDPYYFLSTLMDPDGKWSAYGFSNEEIADLLAQLSRETDSEKRADLAKQIVQISIDENDFGYVGLFNKITVQKTNVHNLAENSPFDFYLLSADTEVSE